MKREISVLSIVMIISLLLAKFCTGLLADVMSAICYICTGSLGLIALVSFVVYTIHYKDWFPVREFIKNEVFGTEKK